MLNTPDAWVTVPDSVKALRETLCVAQTTLGQVYEGFDRLPEHVARLQALVDQLDVLRPLGPDGTHGDLHTPHCGCDVPRPAARRRVRRRRSNGTGTVADAMGTVTGPGGYVFQNSPPPPPAVQYVPVPLEPGMVIRYRG